MKTALLWGVLWGILKTVDLTCNSAQKMAQDVADNLVKNINLEKIWNTRTKKCDQRFCVLIRVNLRFLEVKERAICGGRKIKNRKQKF